MPQDEDAQTARTRPSVLFGAAYYAEYHVTDRMTDRLETDLDLMRDAGFTVIRVGESVWSTWEPREGEYDLEWLAPVLDAAHARGIGVLLGTPTYAAPPWLQKAYPEIAAQTRTGQPVPWGSRQEIDYTHSAFRFHAERVIRAVVARYADHPAVIGYQVDNEPGLFLFHNPATFRRFVAWLRARYGDVETLNREWGLTYWSHRIAHWDELWTPDGNSLPQYDLAWRRFQSEQTAEFIHWQADIVREYAGADQFVMTCIAYPRPAVDDELLTSRLDVAAGNPYFGAQDHLDPAQTLAPFEGWVTSGVAGVLRQADRLYSSRQDRFLVTETGAQSIGGAGYNLPPYPGQLTQAAFALVSRGASMIEYWHWHTLSYGTETYWGGVLPHGLEPGRVYREVAETGRRLAAIGSALDGFDPDADVALLWSTDSRYALDATAPFRGAAGGRDGAYERIVDAFHGGAIDAGAQVRILHTAQALDLGAAALAERYPVLVAAGNYVATDADLRLLLDYAAAGGHLALGPRTGYADDEARARVAVAPDVLRSAAGVRYEEFSTLERDVPVTLHETLGSVRATVDGSAAATLWIDGLALDAAGAALDAAGAALGDARTDADPAATTLATYDHPFFGAFPAVTTRPHGAGRVTVVGTIPNRRLAAAVMAWAVPDPIGHGLARVGLPVTVGSGALPDGRRAWFLFNWSWREYDVELRRDVARLDAADGADAHGAADDAGGRHRAGDRLSVGPWSVATLIDV